MSIEGITTFLEASEYISNTPDITAAELQQLVRQMQTNEQGKATLLYNNRVILKNGDEVPVWKIAEAVGEKHNGAIKTFNQTEASKLLNSDIFEQKLSQRVSVIEAESIRRSLISDISQSLAETASGSVKTMTGGTVNINDIDINSDYIQKELPALLRNTDVTDIDGIARQDLIDFYEQASGKSINEPLDFDALKKVQSETIAQASLNNMMRLDYEIDTNGNPVFDDAQKLRNVYTNAEFLDGTGGVPHTPDTDSRVGRFLDAIDLDQYEGFGKVSDAAGDILKKVGIAGTVLGLYLVSNEVQAAIDNDDYDEAAVVIAEFVGENIGGAVVGLGITLLAAPAIASAGVGAVLGGVLVGGLALAGGYFGGEAGGAISESAMRNLIQFAKDNGIIDDGIIKDYDYALADPAGALQSLPADHKEALGALLTPYGPEFLEGTGLANSTDVVVTEEQLEQEFDIPDIDAAKFIPGNDWIDSHTITLDNGFKYLSIPSNTILFEDAGDPTKYSVIVDSTPSLSPVLPDSNYGSFDDTFGDGSGFGSGNTGTGGTGEYFVEFSSQVYPSLADIEQGFFAPGEIINFYVIVDSDGNTVGSYLTDQFIDNGTQFRDFDNPTFIDYSPRTGENWETQNEGWQEGRALDGGNYSVTFVGETKVLTGTYANMVLVGNAGTDNLSPGRGIISAGQEFLSSLFNVVEGLVGGVVEAVGTVVEAVGSFFTGLFSGGQNLQNVDPLVLDIDGDGVELTRYEDSIATFDVDNDGFIENTGWVHGDDAILAHDLNGDGVINDITETISEYYNGETYMDGFAALATLDSNGDGFFTADDDAYDTLWLWQDVNGDARTDDGELKTLQEMGVESINLNGQKVSREINGNPVFSRSTVTINGAINEALSVDFVTNPIGYEWNNLLEGFHIRSEDGLAASLIVQDQNGAEVDLSVVNNDADPGNDTHAVIGNIGDDVIRGDDGNNWLMGGLGNDSIQAGDGDDILILDFMDDLSNVDAGDGLDVVMMSTGVGSIINLHQINAEMVIGNSGDDTFLGGGPGNYVMLGGAGNDVLIGGLADDILSGEDGDDFIDGGERDDLIRGHRGKDFLIGNDGDDILMGGQDDDKIYGGNGEDLLRGDEGNDYLNGGNDYDIAEFRGNVEDYIVTNLGNGKVRVEDRIANRDGIDILENIEAMNFSDLLQVGVPSVNQNPFAVNDRVDSAGIGTEIISASDLVSNDIDYQGDTLKITNVSDVVGGVATLLTNGNVRFVHDENFQGIKSFTYTVKDSEGNVGINAINISTGEYEERKATVSLREPTHPNDPLFYDQWYMTDVNILPVWEDYTGKGVSVGVFESGYVDADHPDLIENISDETKEAAIEDEYHSHNTLVSGVIAASKNEIGGIGVAYESTLSSVSMGDFTDPDYDLRYRALLEVDQESGEEYVIPENPFSNISNWYRYDVVNNSWGFTLSFSNNFNVTSENKIGTADEILPLLYAVKLGRGGFGTNIVFGAGNDREEGGNTNYSNLTNSPYTITVGAINKDADIGSLEIQADPFSNPGSSILISAPGSNIWSTSLLLENSNGSVFGNDYETINGTSFAAPIVSGIISLMLEANPYLGYRDVQEILAYSARYVNDPSTTWQTNGASDWNGGGLHFSHDYGFGNVDALAAVRLSETWEKQRYHDNLFTESYTTSDTFNIDDSILDIQDLSTGSYTINVVPNEKDISIEHVSVQLAIKHENLSDLTITLISPDGTESVLMDKPQDYAEITDSETGEEILYFDFGIKASWGEKIDGDWILRIEDSVSGNIGHLSYWAVKFYGSDITGDDTYVYTNEFATLSNASRQVLSDSDGEDSINVSAVSGGVSINLTPGTVSTIAGKSLTISSSTIIENVWAGDGNDNLRGNNVDNRLYGGRGNNTLTGGGGGDSFVVIADPGTTTTITDFSIENSAEFVVLHGFDQIMGFEDLILTQDGNDALIALGNEQIIRLKNVESTNLTYSDFSFFNYFYEHNFSSATQENTFIASASAQRIVGSEYGDLIFGDFEAADLGLTPDDPSRDEFPSREEALLPYKQPVYVGDEIYGEGGDDTILGSAAGDRISGGSGNDILLGMEGDDIIFGNEGDDELQGTSGNDILMGGLGEDRVFGEDGDDISYGGDGDDYLKDTSGSNEMYGEAGDDTLESESEGRNLLDGGDGDDTLIGLTGSNDILHGGAGKDVVQSEGSMTRLSGGTGNDRIVFYKGNNNIAYGGAGYDEFIVHRIPNSESIIADLDTYDITDETNYLDFINLVPFEEIQTFDDLNLVQDGSDALILLPESQTLRILNTDISDLDERNFKLVNNTYDLEGAGNGNNNDTEYADFRQEAGTIHVAGGDEFLVLFGGSGDDVLQSSYPEGIVIGGPGHDIIFSGSGTSTQVSGDGGRDLFVIEEKYGENYDVIEDFDADGRITIGDVEYLAERVDLRAFTHILGPEDVFAAIGSFQYAGQPAATSLYFIVEKDPNDDVVDDYQQIIIYNNNGSNFLYGHVLFYENTAPHAVNDNAIVEEDSEVKIDVIFNDGDDADVITKDSIVSFTQAEHGDVSKNDDGTFSYKSNDNYAGNDSFTYTILDSEGLEATATVFLTVNPKNDAPIAVSDEFSGVEDQNISGNLLENDSDIEGNALSVIAQNALRTLKGGFVNILENGDFIYTPPENFYGIDKFNYTLTDGSGSNSIASAELIVAGLNDNPVAQDDVFTTNENTQIEENLLSLSEINSDPDGDNLKVIPQVNKSTNEGGIVNINSDGSFTYTPADGFSGTDSFTYTISDGKGGSDTATVTVTVLDVNDDPAAQDDSVVTDEDTATTIAVLDNDEDTDGDTLSIASVAQGSNGSVSINQDGTLDYTPDANFNGADSFTYTVSDGNGGESTATVNVTVTAVNDLPVSQNDNASVTEDGSVNINVLNNDSDIDLDQLTVSSATQGANGAVSINSNGTVKYTPDANFNGTDTFTYTVSDGQGGTDTASVSVTVNPVNDTPSAQNDAVSTGEDSAATINVLANDSDDDGDALSVTSVTQGAGGSVSINQDGTLDYTPDANFNGADSFTYTISDGNGGSDTATVNVTVTAINDKPVASNDNASTAEDGSVAINVLNNDNDMDQDELTIASVTQGSNGSVSINPDGTLQYTPDENFFGTDEFTYTVSDGQGGTDIASVSVTVSSVNDLPAAQNDSIATSEDTPVIIDVLANDSDDDNDALSVTSVSQGANGSVAINQDGTLTYTPDSNFNGSDSFTYTVSDGNGGSDTASVSVNVGSVNDAPVLINNGGAVNEDSALVLTSAMLSIEDGDTPAGSRMFTLQSTPGNGVLFKNGAALAALDSFTQLDIANGLISYEPNANYNGADGFDVVASDGTTELSVATFSLTVNAVNDQPLANNDNAAVSEDGVVAIDAITNDTDIDADDLNIISVTQGSNGAVSVKQDGTLEYRPDANFNGADSFTYTISDGNGGSDTATVNVSVSAVNDNPVAGNNSASVAEDGSVNINVLNNDSDVDQDQLAVSSVTQGTNGSVSINSNGTVKYTPQANFFGTDSFTYTVNDGNGGTDTATVTVKVSSVNDAPVASNDSVFAIEDTPIVIDVLSNDNDVDAGSLTVSSVTQGANGSVAINQDGTVTYTPDENFNGLDSFTYTVSDGNGGSDTATVSVDVGSVNDVPELRNNGGSVNEDTVLTLNSAMLFLADGDTGPQNRVYTLQDTPDNGVLYKDGNALGVGDTFTQKDVIDSLMSYEPGADYSGNDSFDVVATDGTTVLPTATFNITVAPVNDNPVAKNNSASVAEDGSININVLNNDSDVDQDQLTVSSVTQGANGGVSINSNGTVKYTPNADFNGADNFTYTISDGNGGTDTATVNVTVNPVNDAPVANNDSVSTSEDTPVVIGVLANDSDDDGDALSVISVTQGANGSVGVNPDGTLTYTPDENFNGVDSFTYTVSDGNGGSDTATVNINVDSVNDVPELRNNGGSVNEDTALTLNSAMLFLADGDTGPQNRVYTLQDVPDNGVLYKDGAALTAGDTFTQRDIIDSLMTYEPGADYNGNDSFDVVATDGTTVLPAATFNIVVAPVNDDPTAQDDTMLTSEDEAVTINALNNDSDIDGDQLFLKVVTQGENGSVTHASDGTLTYTPDENFNGTDSFTYAISDDNGGAGFATVNVTVAAVNDAPFALTRDVQTDEDQAITFSMQGFYGDIDSLETDIIRVGDAQHGTVSINQNGTLTYTPDADFFGTDSFSYFVADGPGLETEGTVNVTIASVNDDPNAQNDPVATDEDTPVTFNVLSNDSDLEGDALGIASVSQGANGSVSINQDGTLTYTPNADFFGTDSFTYTVSDGNGGSDTATVSVTVREVMDNANRAPVLQSDEAVTDENQSVTIDVLANDTDSDQDPLSITGFTRPINGTVTINPDNTITYTPNQNYFGIDSFMYAVSDGKNAPVYARITVDVKDKETLILGTHDSETILGDNGRDVIYGYSGDDILQGLDGDDKIYGNSGNDGINGGDGDDILYGSSGDDTLSGSNGNDLLRGGGDNDTLYGGEGDDTLYGDTGDDVLRGEGGNNVLYGNEGNDLLIAYDGYDTLRGGDGDDEMYGGEGDDVMYGDAGNDKIAGDEGDDLIVGNEGDDELYGGAGDDYISGHEGHDRMYGDEGEDNLRGWTGNDLISGGDDNDYILGQDGDDRLYGGSGDDRVYGGKGDDEMYGNDGDDYLHGSLGRDTIRGHAGNDYIIGHDGDDYLRGYEGADTIIGGDGNDTLLGNDGEDYLHGGHGDDYMVGDEGNDTMIGHTGNDLLQGGAGDDYMHGADDDDRLYGGDGNDLMKGGNGQDSLQGDAGNDRLYGNNGDDALHGNEGDDLLAGQNGDDRLYGDAGNDRLYGSYGDDTLRGGTGHDYLNGGYDNDTLYGEEGHDRLIGYYGDDIVYGGAGNDRLYGQDGDDELHGGDDHDKLYGNAGNDTLYGDAGDDFLNGYEGNDVLYGGTGSDRLYGYEDDDNLYGGEDDDNLYGGEGHDSLSGGAGDDTILGGAGNDILRGGAGYDRLFGDAGADTFVIDLDTLSDGATDQIFGFSVTEGDKIDVSELLENYDPLTDAISDFVEIYENSTHSYIRIDETGQGNFSEKAAAIRDVTGLADEQTLVDNGVLIV